MIAMGPFKVESFLWTIIFVIGDEALKRERRKFPGCLRMR